MTLAQLGAEVIRVDPVAARADITAGRSLMRARAFTGPGLNKGKRSVAADLRSPRGQASCAFDHRGWTGEAF